MTSRQQPSLRLLSLNVNGLRASDKRRTLFSLLHRDTWDVVLLQETHHASREEGEEWAQEGPHGLRPNWTGPTFWSHGSTTSCGVAILIRPQALVSDITARHVSTDGRTLMVDFTFTGTAFTAVSVYAPCVGAARAPYFTASLLPHLPEDRQLLVGGDFNCIAEQLDLLDPHAAPGGRLTGYHDGLRYVEAERQLFDVWRERHPGHRTFTHTGTAGTSARLDRWLVSQDIRPWALTSTSTGQTHGYPGDHLGVSLTLTAPGGTAFGASAWRLPLHLLDDQPFCTEMEELIPKYLEEHPISPGLSRRDRWVHLKNHIRLRAVRRSTAIARQRRDTRSAIERDSRLAQALYEGNPRDGAALTAWLDAHQLLQALHSSSAQTAALQAGVVWQQYGEQSTFWFHHLARERREKTVISELRPSANAAAIPLDTPAGVEQGRDILQSYYSSGSPAGLFASRNVSLPAQEALLAAVDRHLSAADSAAAEGPARDGSITLAELTQAVKELPRGKSPGLDGLPYEFYQKFWALLGPELTAVLHEAFVSGASPGLPQQMLQGRIILLYKGKGADRALAASYRPITLLNTDYKMAARSIATRMGPALNRVIDSTQTGFLPQRWIGDNVLSHLEEIAYLEETQLPGVILFLDFEKAFDRIDRGWIERCTAVVGFGQGMQRWVHILHAGTSARVAFNGWHTDAFPVSSGVFQGSPLSPLLFVLATQPMAAHARRTAAAFQPRQLPSGHLIPVMHQHADDTTVHASSPEEANQLLNSSVDLHCQATGSKLQRSKSQGLGLGAASHLTGVEPVTGVTFTAAGESIRHLGIPLQRDADAAAAQLYDSILERLNTRIARWSGFHLSLLGRSYVAKQALVSMFTYHATFISVPQPVLAQLTAAVYTFVAANRPLTAGAAALFPSRDVCIRDTSKGGISLVDIRGQLAALQAKIIARLLEPEHLPWKAFFDFWLYRSSAWIDSQASPPTARQQHAWQLGRFLPFSTFDLAGMAAPPRVVQYLTAFRQLQPHRLQPTQELAYEDIMGQPLFHSRSILDSATGQPLQWFPWARQHIVRVGDLRQFMAGGPAEHDAPEDLGRLLPQLPPAWLAALRGPQRMAPYLASPDVSDSRVWCPGPEGVLLHSYSLQPSGNLQPTDQPPAEPPLGLVPAVVLPWDPTRPWRPNATAAAASPPQADPVDDAAADAVALAARPLYMAGTFLYGGLDPRTWGFGRQPVHEFIVKAASSRHRVLHRIRSGDSHPMQPMRPAIWADTPGDPRSGIQHLEQHWESSYAARQQAADLPSTSAAGGHRRALAMGHPSTDAPWMHPAPPRSPPKRARLALVSPPLQGAQQRPPPQPPDETVDMASPPSEPPPAWSTVWRTISSSDLDRAARVTAWRILHGKLFVGAFLRHVHRGSAASHLCPHGTCQQQLATLTHVFLACPTAAPVWHWFANIWAALTAGPAPRLTADLLLADDPRGGWYPPASLLPLWQRLRLLVISRLWAAYSTAHLQPAARVTATQIAARVLSAAKSMMRRDWLLVDTDIRQQTDMLSDWLRGRQPSLSRAEYGSRWCHNSLLCRLADAEAAQPDILWSATHPVPLP